MSAESVEILSRCEECGATFYYSPRYHKCADDGPPLANPYAGMSWVEECMTKQREERP